MSTLENGPKQTRHSSGSKWKDGSIPGPGLASGCSYFSGHSLGLEGNMGSDPASKASLGGEEGGAPMGASLQGSRRTGRNSKQELLQGHFSGSGACTRAPAGYKGCFWGPSPVAESNRLGVWPGSKLPRRLRHQPATGDGWGGKSLSPQAMSTVPHSQHFLPFLCTLCFTAFSCSLWLFLEIRGGKEGVMDTGPTPDSGHQQLVCRGHREALPCTGLSACLPFPSLYFSF